MILGMVRNRRGAGTIGCLFMIVVVAAGMYAGFQFGLPKLRHSSFENRVNESLGTLKQQSAADVQKQLIQFASDFDILLTPAQVKVDNSQGKLSIDLSYEKVIDLYVWRKTMPFRMNLKPAKDI
jgi:hypothetical protein